jgi:hypothetical protein
VRWIADVVSRYPKVGCGEASQENEIDIVIEENQEEEKQKRKSGDAEEKKHRDVVRSLS